MRLLVLIAPLVALALAKKYDYYGNDDYDYGYPDDVQNKADYNFLDEVPNKGVSHVTKVEKTVTHHIKKVKNDRPADGRWGGLGGIHYPVVIDRPVPSFHHNQGNQGGIGNHFPSWPNTQGGIGNHFPSWLNTQGVHFPSPSQPKDTCRQPVNPGVCTGHFPRWAFHKDSGTCKWFSYGGCGGNENNFHSKDACQRRCGHGVISPPVIFPPVITPTVPTKLTTCQLPANPGLCKGHFPRWAFHKDSGTCKWFSYGGCGGNENNFHSKDACLRKCGHGGSGSSSTFPSSFMKDLIERLHLSKKIHRPIPILPLPPAKPVIIHHPWLERERGWMHQANGAHHRERQPAFPDHADPWRPQGRF